MSKRTHDTPRLSGFCCYILQSEHWPTPYTGKTCDPTRRLHRHNHPSKRSRAYTKGKGPWRIAAAVFGMSSNRQSVWLERALKRHCMPSTAPVPLVLALFRVRSSMPFKSVVIQVCGGAAEQASRHRPCTYTSSSVRCHPGPRS